VKVAVIDIGSNTARLLVASVEGDRVTQLCRERHYLRLGDDVHARGRIGQGKLAEAGEVARIFAHVARKAGADELETIVTAPGRQASNGGKLVRTLRQSTQSAVVVLTGEDEGRLAWRGAVPRMEDPPETVAVVDLGGGSCELAVGAPSTGPRWVRLLDAGALRVTRLFLDGGKRSRKRVLRARDEISALVAVFDAERPDAVLAVGGTARALARIVGRRLGSDRLDELVTTLSQTTVRALTKDYGITPQRAETLLGGTLVLAEISRRLDSELEVGRGGLREGAAIALAGSAAVAA
jgi:exopolyphosphatase / guanosine-5'-triphosphate,3'-diphosphate pyrophosphatase